MRRYLISDNPKLGESRILQVLSGFSCPKNPDVEWFFKKSSIEFTKRNQSVTYLVFDVSSMELVGYFAIALKPLTVRGETVRGFYHFIMRTVFRHLIPDRLRQTRKNCMGLLLYQRWERNQRLTVQGETGISEKEKIKCIAIVRIYWHNKFDKRKS